MIDIFNEECVEGSKIIIQDNSVDLIICDPPFGIEESMFEKHYYRDEELVLEGYIEAPVDYEKFSFEWISECKRILKDNGSFYIISGWTNLHHILNAVNKLNLNIVNHIIWKYNFGVSTKRKFVSSHYHILYITMSKKSKPTFNTYCRFGFDEKTKDNRSLNYADMEDVWCIPKEYQSGEIKSSNKLPEELVKKIIQYSSNEGNLVCDFFLGNFTTAIVSKKMGRNFIGFELNKKSYDYFSNKMENIEFGSDLVNLKIVEDGTPSNQGKKLEQKEIDDIKLDFNELNKTKTKKDVINILIDKYGRGRWSLERIIKR
jgi:site-specific DNA-methyltransferase (adenine-specific)